MNRYSRQAPLALVCIAASFACSPQQGPAAEEARPARIALGRSQAQAASPTLSVFVGYADSLRPDGNFPIPWQGSPNTIFIGGCDSFDSGAIRLDNSGSTPLAIDDVTVDLQRPGPSFSLWGSFTIPAGGSAILAQTTCYNFDTSDFDIVGCGGTPAPGDPRVPKITVTAGGASTSFIDTGHVLDTGGFDLVCQVVNESLQWRPVGSAGIGSVADTLALAPDHAQAALGSAYTATATLLDPSNGPVANVLVQFSLSAGPNAGRTGSATTDAQGRAQFSYSSTLAGTDTLIASVTNATGGSFQSNTATVSWTPPVDACPAATPPGPLPPVLTYLGATAGEFGDAFFLAALLTNGNGTPLIGRALTFSLGAQTAAATTDARGVARATLTPSGTPGATPLSVSFAGDAANQPAQATLSAAIDRDETVLRYTGSTLFATPAPPRSDDDGHEGDGGDGKHGYASDGHGGHEDDCDDDDDDCPPARVSQTVTAVLTDPEDQQPIPGSAIVFKLGVDSATATTDAHGVATATLSLPGNAALGPATVSVSFAGDTFHKPSSTSAPVIRYTASQFVIWGGNPTALKIGDRVNFFGPQWGNQVKGGDFASNRSFKGNAAQVTAFALCEAGAHTAHPPLLDTACWTTKPGDSDSPGRVPSYIGVIVTNAMSKSGSKIYGNIAGLALLRVDSSSCGDHDHDNSLFGTLIGMIDRGGILPAPATLVASQTQPQTALPGQLFQVSLDLVAGSSASALGVSIAEAFGGSAPAAATATIATVGAQHLVKAFAETAPPAAPRAAAESSAAYQSRLAALDGTPLTSSATIGFNDALGQPQLPVLASSFGLLSLPRLALALTGVPCVGPGITIPYALTVTNLGSAASTGAIATVTFPDGTSAAVPIADLAPGATSVATVSWTVPPIAAKAPGESNAAYAARLASFDGITLTAVARVTWKDAAANSYGAVEQSFQSVERVPILRVDAPALGELLPSQRSPLAFGVTDVGTGSAPIADLQLSAPGGAIIDAASFSLVGGQSVSQVLTAVAPAIAPRQVGESDLVYLTRLASADGALLAFDWASHWRDTAGDPYGPLTGEITGSEVVPVLEVSLGAPASAVSGGTITYTLTVLNHGHAAAAASVTLTLPDGTTRAPALATVAPGTLASATVTYAIPASFPGGNLNASAVLAWDDAIANHYGPISASATTRVTHPNLAPVVFAGNDQTLQLPASAALNGSVSDDGFPAGAPVTSSWTMVSGPGPVVFANSSAPVTSATFTVAGTYLLRLTASDTQLQSSSDVTITVNAQVTITATIVLAPAASGPVVTGSQQALTATVTDGGGAPIAGLAVTFTVSGPNATTGTGTTGAGGVASFQYLGNSAGNDSIVARASVGGNIFSSNIATVAWITPVQIISTTSVFGRFFASNGSGPFNTPVTATPAFSQNFPTIDFNPPSGTIPGDTSGVGVFTRPFTDVTTDLNGNFTGTIVAQGNGQQAGSGGLFDFQAVFTGSFVVAAAADIPISFFSDDGFILGVGNGATRVSGPLLNVPPSGLTPFELLPVLGAFNQATAPVANTITVHFPAAGVYPYEVDYSECCGGQLAITMAATNGHGIPPTGSLILSPNTVATRPAGASQSFTVTAVDASNIAQPNVQVQLSISGANAQSLTSITGANGRADFSYLGIFTGTDSVQATASFTNSPAFSNQVLVTWQVNPNQPTVSQPATAGSPTVSGTSTTLSARGNDAAGEAGLTYAWSATGPGPVTFTPNGTNAAKDTVATFSAGGSYTITVAITNAAGFTNTSSVSVSVTAALFAASVSPASATVPINASPSFAAVPVDQFGHAAPGPFTYQWSKLSGPGGVSFGAAAASSTTASFDSAGDYLISVSVSDGTRTVSGTSAVSAQVINQAPIVSAGPAQTLTQPASTVTLAGSASDDGLPAGSTLSVTWSHMSGPSAVSFATPHQAITAATFHDVGIYVLRLTASDSALSSSSDVSVTVLPPAGVPPTVSLTSPADGSVLTSPTPVIGSVSGGFWKLEYVAGGAAGSAPIVFASGSGAVNGGVLGSFDPSQLRNGTYALQLTATTDQGSSTASLGVAVQGKQKVGLFSLAFPDLKLPVGGLPINLTRVYDSRDKSSGDFGVGWRLQLNDVRVEKTQVIGQFWEEVERPIFFFPEFCLQPTKVGQVTITFNDGRLFKFDTVIAGDACSVLFPWIFGSIAFTPATGTQGSLVALDTSSFMVSGGPVGPVQLLDDGTFEVLDPKVFQLTAGDGTVFVLDQDRGVQSITDRNGNQISFGPGGILSSNGPSVPFTRDGQGRITAITDLNGKSLHYAYDAAGDLVASTDRTSNTTTYTYDDAHGLLTVTDPLGATPIRNDYDDSGRVIRTTDALGNTILYSYDVAHNRTTITDRNGHTTSISYDASGNVLSQTDALGRTIGNTFDANNNRLSATDALGHTTSWTYDANFHITSKTDALGNTTSTTYNPFGEPLTVTDPLGRVTTSAYDVHGNLTSTTDGSGAVTSHSYEPSGRRSSTTDPAGRITRFAYDGAGNLSQVTDGNGTLTGFTYDANGNRLSSSVTRTTPTGPQSLITRYEYDFSGRRTAVIHPDGTRSETEYNPDGKKSATVDELGQRTGYQYDPAGRLTETDYPDGTRATRVYDANGNATSTTDRAGRTTTSAYDAADRRVLTTNPDGTTVGRAWDADDRVAGTTDENGISASTSYDANGNPTLVQSPAGSLQFAYDNAGNRRSATDPNGNTTLYAHDALGRVTQKTLADGTSQSWIYDGSGSGMDINRAWPATRSVDQAGVATDYTYDANGHVLSVKDGLGQTTSYTYDEVGNRLTVTDANGHTTRFEYDPRGREVKRTLPAGQIATRRYDAAGRLIGRTDFNGHSTSFSYDATGRLASRTPDPALGEPAVRFTYTASGQRATMIDATGTTTYTYDARDRLTLKATPFGSLIYTYDPAGNRLTLRSDDPAGVMVDYTRDGAERLASVIDRGPGGGATQYTYDPSGNPTSYSYPNGVTTSLDYDNLRRVKAVRSLLGAQQLSSYAYTFQPTGLRASLTELSGRTVSWTHDPISRLTQETIAGDPAGVNGSVGYTWDPTGNRLARTSTVAPVSPQSETYDANDRLFSDSVDDEGNTLGAAGQSYAYDFENHLLAANSGSVRLRYDGDGNLVSKTAGGVTTTYLVDDTDRRRPAQVVEERVGGHAVRSYVYGLALISQRDAGGVHYALYDGRHDVRQLTNAAGAATDSYDYDAFGVALHAAGPTSNAFRYRGERQDADLGLTYLRARFLRQNAGRFLTRDALFDGNGKAPLSFHKYLYASADPVDRIDPTGRQDLIETSEAIALSEVLVESGFMTEIAAATEAGIFGAELELEVAEAIAVAYAEGLGASEGTVMLIGAEEDILALEVGEMEQILQIKNWTTAANEAWMQAGVARNAIFKLVSDLASEEAMLSTEHGITMFARELEFLAQQGYRLIGPWAIPPL